MLLTLVGAYVNSIVPYPRCVKLDTNVHNLTTKDR